MIRALGWSCIAAGLLANPVLLGPILSEDGRIESVLFNGLILLTDAVAIAVGVYLVRHPRRAALFNVGLFAISLLTATFIAELGARLFLFGSAALSPRMMASVSDSRLREFVRAVDNPDLGYALKPELDVLFKLVPLHTNTDGLHDKEYPRKKASNTFRIAVVGDSFTMPAGVSLKDAWHSRIEVALNDKGRERRFEVINFGVAGYDLRQYVAVLKSVANAYNPDMVLIGFCAENDHQIGADPAAMMATSPDRSGLPVSYLYKLLAQMNYASHTDMSKKPTPDESAYVAEQFAALAAATDAPIVVAYLANLPRDGAAAVAALAEAASFGFVDVSDAFSDMPLAPFAIYHPIDSHPNAAANAVFAEKILAYLQDNASMYLGGLENN